MKTTQLLYTQSFQYDFDINGGAQGTISTGAGCIPTGVSLPKYSLIVVGCLLVQSTLHSATDSATITLCQVNNTLLTIKNLGGAPATPGGSVLGLGGGPAVPTLNGLELLIAIGAEDLLSGKFLCLITYYSPINSLT